MTHVCLFFSQTLHKLTAWSYFSSSFLFGSGPELPLESRGRKALTALHGKGRFKNTLGCLCTLLSLLNILGLQPVLLSFTSPVTFNKHKIILRAPIYAHPGYICIYYIAELQKVSLTKTTENCSRE